MGKATSRKKLLKQGADRIKVLEEQVEEGRRVMAREISLRDDEIRLERLKRESAQRGLVPYVRSLEAFDRWLKRRPALKKRLQPILSELGIYEVRLGYDPAQDLSHTVLTPRRARVHE